MGDTSICYFSTIPTGMTVAIFKEHLQEYESINRIYLVPKKVKSTVKKKQREYSEGWVEFLNKNTALKIADKLNATPVAGSKRRAWHGELWNVRALEDTTWNDLFSHEVEQQITHRSAHDKDIVEAKRIAEEFKQDVLLEKIVDKRNRRKKLMRQRLTEDEIKSRMARSHRTGAEGLENSKAAINDKSFMNTLFSI